MNLLSPQRQLISSSQKSNMLLNDAKFEQNSNSILNISERNDSRNEFLFGKSHKKEVQFDKSVSKSNVCFGENSNPVFFSNQLKLFQSQKSSVEEGQFNAQTKTMKEISEYVRQVTSNSEQDGPQKNDQKIHRNGKSGNKKVSQVHSAAKTPTLQSQNKNNKEFLHMFSFLKKPSLFQNGLNQKDTNNSMFSSIKQKNAHFAINASNLFFGEKTDTLTQSGSKKVAFLWNCVNKQKKVLQFINNLKNISTLSSSYRSLNQKHHELIADKADINNESNQIIAGKMKFLFDNCIKKIPIFSPESPKMIFWNFVVAIYLLIQFVVIPLKICFFIEFTSLVAEIFLYYLPSFVFILEIFVLQNVSFYQEGILVKSRFKIIQNYMFKRYLFWLDLITTIIFLISQQSHHPLQIFFVLLRLFQFSQLINDIDELYQITQRFSSQKSLITLLLLILILAHFTGCGFHYIAYLQSEQGIFTWIDKQKIFNQQWQIRYLTSVYWASITMITVGYGDIVPITSAEKIYVIIMTLISAGVFGYSINTIGSIFGEIQKQKAVMKQLIFLQNNITPIVELNQIQRRDIQNQDFI